MEQIIDHVASTLDMEPYRVRSVGTCVCSVCVREREHKQAIPSGTRDEHVPVEVRVDLWTGADRLPYEKMLGELALM